jgi:hypothetical protein
MLRAGVRTAGHMQVYWLLDLEASIKQASQFDGVLLCVRRSELASLISCAYNCAE